MKMIRYFEMKLLTLSASGSAATAAVNVSALHGDGGPLGGPPSVASCQVSAGYCM
jgi:hypothetical protein